MRDNSIHIASFMSGPARIWSTTAQLLVSGLFVAHATLGMWCDHGNYPPEFACGDPPPEALCPGRCYTYTFSIDCGVCVWCGHPWHSCSGVEPFPTKMTKTAYLCDIFVVKYGDPEEFMCICSDHIVQAETVISDKTCNCL